MKRRQFNKNLIGSVATGTIASSGMLGMGGCSSLNDILNSLGITQPKVKVLDMNITKWSLDTLGTVFDIGIDNPNNLALNLAGISYGLLINGNRLTSGNSNKAISLKANGQSTTQLAFDFPLAQTGQALLSLLKSRNVAYGLQSALKVAVKGQSFNVPLNHKGSLNVPKLPKFGVPTFKFSGLRGTNLGFSVIPEFQNDNGFDLPLGGLISSLKLNGRPVISNQNTALNLLRKNAKTPVPMNFNVGLGQLGLSALDMIKKPSVSWGLDLGLKSGLFKLPFSKAGNLRLG